VIVGESGYSKKAHGLYKEKQLRESIHKWLFLPDPSLNHNIARGAHHEGTTAWFFEKIFRKWKPVPKTTETGSLLWIYGKRASCSTASPTTSDSNCISSWFRQEHPMVRGSFINPSELPMSSVSSSIIEYIAAIAATSEALLAYFYFYFRNVNKQHLHDLIPSLLIQFSAHLGPRCDILLHLYEEHDSGKRQPSDHALVTCLKGMLFTVSMQACPIYLVMDALDECPDTFGIPSPRERVLKLVKELVELPLPSLHIIVTSRPEVDIWDVLIHLKPLQVCLHDQEGQKADIRGYVESIVSSDSEQIMRRWSAKHKKDVIDELSKRANGM